MSLGSRLQFFKWAWLNHRRYLLRLWRIWQYYGGLSILLMLKMLKHLLQTADALRTTLRTQSFPGLQNAEKASFNLECQTIKDMLQDGRSDDAIATLMTLLMKCLN